MCAATSQTGNRALDSPDTREIALTIRAFVNVTPGAFADREGEIVTAPFIADPEIITSGAPFRTVR